MNIVEPHYDPTSRKGHYESWFIRGNHPTRPLSFWIRYTIFSPIGIPQAATVGLWAVWYDGETDTLCSAHHEIPYTDSFFGSNSLNLRIGDAVLTSTQASGSIMESIAWNMTLTKGSGSLLFLPSLLYKLPVPPAKSLVIDRNVRFRGKFVVSGVTHDIEDWVGTVNHNWGPRHTDEYAWGQVTSFDDAPGAFFECLTARIQLLGVRTPWVTMGLLHLEGKTHRIISLHKGLSGAAPYQIGTWRFVGYGFGIVVHGEIFAPDNSFMDFKYRNPPGGVKDCHNSGLASATLHVWKFGKKYVLKSRNQASFEILSDPVTIITREAFHPTSLSPVTV